jgi:hypothetical protein
LIHCCGLEVQKPTQVLKSVKGPEDTFDLNPKWARTLPTLIYFSWDIYRDPPPQKIRWWVSGTQAHSSVSNINFDI